MPDIRPTAPPGLEWVLPTILTVFAVVLVLLVAWWLIKNRRR